MQKIREVENTYLALDFGGTASKYAYMNADGVFLKKGKTKVPTTVDEIVDIIAELLKIKNVKGIAISIPGIIDSEYGIAHTGGILEYLKDTPLASILKKAFALPVWIENDAKCAGKAEVVSGSLKNVKDGAVIVLGTGVGGCLILNHEVRSGMHLRSGEFSDIFIEHDRTWTKKECRWWDVNGREGLLHLVQRYTGDFHEWTGYEIFEKAKNGNKKIREAISEFCFYLAIEIYNIQAIVDVECFAIGGGISDQPLLIKMIQEHIDDIFKRDVDFTVVKPKISACAYKNDANLLGALYGFLEMYQKEIKNI